MTKSRLLFGSTATVALLAGVAHAQTSEPATTNTNQSQASTEGALETIIVTALKRETDLQRTPAVVDVVQASALQGSGITNIAAIDNMAPALNFGSINGLYTTVAIRGVSSLDATELGDPAVAFNIDGEYINRPLNLSATLFDIQRIEVLRGPQGTLYGRNATAGAINIITNAPTHEFAGAVTASVGDYNLRALQGFVNVPLGDDFAVRFAGIVNQRDGTVKYENGERGDDQDMTAGRVRLLYSPNDRLEINVTGELIKTGGNGTATKGIILTGVQPAGTLPTNLNVDIGDRDQFPVGIDPYVRTEQRDVRGTITYDFGPVQFTNTAGYRKTRLDSLFNFHGTPVWTSDFNNAPSEYETFGNETRFSGDISGVTWQVGYYYFDEDQNAHVNVYQNVSAFAAPRDTIPRLIFDYDSVKAKSNAVFGEVNVPIGDRFSVTAGIRHTKDEKSRVGSQRTLNVAALNASSGAVRNYTVTSLNGETESNRTNYNLVLNYQATDASMLYAKYTTGYKAGGFDTVGQYGPEDLKAYEAGTKNQFLGGTLQLNAAAFYYKYTDQQIATLLTLPNGTNANATQNAASNKPYGAELEVVSQFTNNDRFRFTVDYLNASFDVFNAAVTAFGGATLLVDLSGNRPPFTPEWTVSASYSHTFRTAFGDLTPTLTSAYKTEYFTAATNYPGDRQKAYTKTDFTLTWLHPSERFDVTAFVRNIEDERTLRYGAFAFVAGQTVYRYNFSEPRTFGLTATVHF